MMVVDQQQPQPQRPRKGLVLWGILLSLTLYNLLYNTNFLQKMEYYHPSTTTTTSTTTFTYSYEYTTTTKNNKNNNDTTIISSYNNNATTTIISNDGDEGEGKSKGGSVVVGGGEGEEEERDDHHYNYHKNNKTMMMNLSTTIPIPIPTTTFSFSNSSSIITTTTTNTTTSTSPPPPRRHYFFPPPVLLQELPSGSCRTSDGTLHNFPIFPDFIVIGVQKGGTTALYQLLKRLPNLQSSLKVEPHLFDFKFKRNKLCETRKLYYEKFYEHNTNSTTTTTTSNTTTIENYYPTKKKDLIFDITPSYIAESQNVPRRVQLLCPHLPKIIVLLRNPVDRAFSHYTMTYGSYLNSNRTHEIPLFKDLVETFITNMKELNVTNVPLLSEHRNWTLEPKETFTLPMGQELNTTSTNINTTTTTTTYHHFVRYRDLFLRGLYSRQLVEWMKIFPLHDKMKIISSNDFTKNQSHIIKEILEFVNHPNPNVVNEIVSSQLATKNFSPNKKRLPSQFQLSDSTRSYLQRFYQPYNDELADLLNDDQ